MGPPAPGAQPLTSGAHRLRPEAGVRWRRRSSATALPPSLGRSGARIVGASRSKSRLLDEHPYDESPSYPICAAQQIDRLPQHRIHICAYLICELWIGVFQRSLSQAVDTPRWASREASVVRNSWNSRSGRSAAFRILSHFLGLNLSLKSFSWPSGSVTA